jgi:HPt (histidine-containing phosphotransfer) domain-containing protein
MTGSGNPGNNAPAIDRKVLDRLFELQDEADPRLVAELIEMFFESSPERIEQLLAAARTENLRKVETVAHDFKSSAANLGALRLSSLAADLEVCGRKGKLEPVHALIDELKREYERAREELAKIAQKIN